MSTFAGRNDGGKIGLFAVSSTLGPQLEVGGDVAAKVAELSKLLGRKALTQDLITSIEDAVSATRSAKGEVCGSAIAVATGGTENLIKEIARKLDKPILILANPSNNSLPSSIEAYSELKKEGSPVKLYYSKLNSRVIEEIESFISVCKSIHHLRSCKLGYVGELEASVELVSSRIGPKIIEFGIDGFIDLIAEVDDQKAEEFVKELNRNFDVTEPSHEDLLNAGKGLFGNEEPRAGKRSIGADDQVFRSP